MGADDAFDPVAALRGQALELRDRSITAALLAVLATAQLLDRMAVTHGWPLLLLLGGTATASAWFGLEAVANIWRLRRVGCANA